MMNNTPQSHPRPTLIRWLRSNLRAKLALGLALPLLLILSTISLLNYARAKRNLEAQMALTAEQLGEVTLSSLRQGMLMNDTTLTGQVLGNVVQMEDISQAQVINLGGEPVIQRRSANAPREPSGVDITCTVCHQYPASERPRSLNLGSTGGILRVAAPIQNDPECRTCHREDASHLGVLLLDVSISEMQVQLRRDLQSNLALSGGSTLLVTLAAYFLSNSLVVRRLAQLREPLAKFSAGDFSARMEEENASDEVGNLARAFNEMAEDLQRASRAAEARTQVRQRAILQERDRIARELHDGVAQLLGYVNTKAVAARLMVRDGNTTGAQKLLSQLEAASKELFTDVRVAILGLKASNSAGLVFPENLRQYVDRFRDLSGMSVEVEVGRVPLPHGVPAETELQLLRITQEALANSHKHSQATSAEVSIDISEQHVELRVADNGVGFDPDGSRGNGRPHFGLSTMRERAEAIDGELTIASQPGEGTVVIVRAPLPKGKLP